MKKTYFIMLLFCLFINIQAQNFGWSKAEGLWAYDYGYGITTDNVGNVYVAGKYEMNANFSNTILPDQGNHDIYIARYSSTGTLDWIKTAGGSNGDYARAISCDGVNYVYTAGEIEGYGVPIIFEGTNTQLNCIGDNDIFLAKYDLIGNFIWAKQAGGMFSEKALGITHDHNGNVYVCGYFNNNATFETTTISGYGNNDIFIAKYDMDGNFLWVRKAGSPERDEAKSIKCDAAGNVYICGMYSNGANFGNQVLTSPNGYFNSFVAQYAPDGTLNWVKTAGGDYDDVAWSLTLDNAGKIYITGEFNAYALFDGFPLVTSGNADAFVVCYDASGNVEWATSAGGTQVTGNLVTRARGIGCDGTNVYITGQFGAIASFGSFDLTAADSSDIFIAKLNNSGTFLWATSVGGTADDFEELGYESGNTICAEASGNVYATGSLLSGGTFGGTVISGYGRTDVFITKILQSPTSVVEIKTINEYVVYPNPSNGQFVIDLASISAQRSEIQIFNGIGELIASKVSMSSLRVTFDLSDQVKGVYFVEIKNDQSLTRKKLIIQ